jgi:hypothetical protein
MGYRPFIDSPLDSIDIYMIEYDFMVEDYSVYSYFDKFFLF